MNVGSKNVQFDFYFISRKLDKNQLKNEIVNYLYCISVAK